jgi:hypothetical protein
VLCPGDVGPVLKTTDPDFISLMESCPCRCYLFALKMV